MQKAKTSRSVPRPAAQNIYQLKITLRYIQPPIWRRVLVADNLLLGDLHPVICPAMGWHGGHMHAFRFGGGFNPVEYSTAASSDGFPSDSRNENSVYLSQLIRRKGQTFSYEYDFGDSWQHEVKVEKILPFDSKVRLPVCLAGARGCPPEDCGGIPGYAELLRVLRDAVTEEDRELKRWAENYRPEYFNLDAVNRRMR